MSSFGHAFRGLFNFFSTEVHAQFHAIAVCAVGCLGIWLRISPGEWLWLVVAVVMVLVAETFNSALESTCNALTQDYNEHIRQAKDKAAGAVLVSAIGAATIGSIIFIPKLFSHL